MLIAELYSFAFNKIDFIIETRFNYYPSILKIVLYIILWTINIIWLIPFTLLIIFFYIITFPHILKTLKVNKKRREYIKKIDSGHYIIICNNKTWNQFFKNKLSKSLDEDMKFIWYDKRATFDESTTSIINLIKTHYQKIDYAIYVHFDNGKYYYNNIRNILFRYKKGRLSFDDLIDEIQKLKKISYYNELK